MADSQLYSRLLLSKGAGYPLWLPEPYDDLPTEYKETGCSIGDVGVITSEGAFDFIFNICVPGDHPINRVGVPEDFEVVALGQGDIRRAPRHYSPGSDISSAKLKKRNLAIDANSGDNPMIPAGGGAGFSISTSSREAAVLLLPDGGASIDLRRKQVFRDYALKHADNWYRFVNIQLGRMIDNGAIYLVTGADKTTSWGVACFSQDTSEGEISLELKASLVATGHVSYSWQSTNVTPVASRAGPEEPGNLNQAVFLRGYKVMLRERFATLRGPVKVFPVEGAKPRDLLARKSFVPYSEIKQSSRADISGSGSSGPADGEVFIDFFPEPLHVYHPSDLINALLLENTQTTSVAVTHDTEWSSVLQDEPNIPDGSELYRRLCDKYTLGLSEDGGVFFDSSEDIPESPTTEFGQSSIENSNLKADNRSSEQNVPRNTSVIEEAIASARLSQNSERAVRLLLLGQSESAPKPRNLRSFFTSITESSTSVNIISSVRDMVTIQNLATTDLL